MRFSTKPREDDHEEEEEEEMIRFNVQQTTQETATPRQLKAGKTIKRCWKTGSNDDEEEMGEWHLVR